MSRVDDDTHAASRGLEFAGPQSVVTWLGEIERPSDPFVAASLHHERQNVELT